MKILVDMADAVFAPCPFEIPYQDIWRTLYSIYLKKNMWKPKDGKVSVEKEDIKWNEL